MKKILFLLPPSEGKNSGGEFKSEKLSFIFEKPSEISINVTEKDLKCKGKRFEEGIFLNKNIEKGTFDKSIKRYSGVMYNGIDYSGMSEKGKEFFEKNFLILSGMYGILKPLDIIGNYKLPIETKGLYDFFGSKIIEKINDLNVDYVVNLLPISYGKLILGKTKKLENDFNKIRNYGIINVNFLQPHPDPLLRGEGSKYIKVSHGVKKIKGEWIRNICENNVTDYKYFGGDVVDLEEGIIEVNIIIE